MLYLIGLGLGSEKDITVRGLEVVKSATRVYLEAYTSILGVGKERLEQYYGREVILADRELVESGSDEILRGADKDDIAFLVVGAPFGATTHSDLMLRAQQEGIPVKAIHNCSIMNAVGVCGLQLYKYGQAISQVFWDDEYGPDSYYDKIVRNKSIGLHTLCLLDIKVKEQTIENMMRGRKIFEPPRYMTINQAVDQLLKMEERHGKGVTGPDAIAVACVRMGHDDQLIVAGTLSELQDRDYGAPLHTLVLAGDLHFSEAEVLERFAVNPQSFEKYKLAH
eukprot:Colp12_sorted_trinity150504_noHs@4100